MEINDIIFGTLLVLLIVASLRTGKLTNKAALAAAFVAIAIYLGTGLYGIVFLGTFFLLGVMATSWKSSSKETIGFAETNKGKRNAKQVLANGGVACMVGWLAFFIPEEQPIFLLMIACSFSAATSDTLSSELGMVYGKRTYNILTMKADTRGENGMISFEGTLIGIAGSVIIAALYFLMTDGGWYAFMVIIIAGTIGNIADSLLGATLERMNVIGNNAVNLINTLIGALVGALIA